MARFTCTTYPQLEIGGIVRFIDGVCETSQKEALAQLRSFAADPAYGISEQDPPDGAGEGNGGGPDGMQRPARSASKADWKAYAVRQGMDADATEKASRDELAAQYTDGGDS
ncbi:hypothetical protein [Streptomyces sp. CC224B]|uniref:hypothetical protein n=1 Tax=Streptomyces sp. CC224B TaxID=3044571 RepID=UPI0024A9A9F5|nr:hypothetical protein [Streptomyces sp. CC224B]